MASVIKNPMILNSANYIYNWFLTMNDKNENLIKNNNILEIIESDEAILNRLDKNKENEERYQNVSDRLKKAEEEMNGK